MGRPARHSVSIQDGKGSLPCMGFLSLCVLRLFAANSRIPSSLCVFAALREIFSSSFCVPCALSRLLDFLVRYLRKSAFIRGSSVFASIRRLSRRRLCEGGCAANSRIPSSLFPLRLCGFA
jgi:hypothetical protein